MPDRAEEEYRHALNITLQWLDTYHFTGRARDLETALACSRIARERFTILQRKRVHHHNYRELILIERQAEMDAVVDEVRQSIAECRALFERVDQLNAAE